jgi:hypothetical protein
MGCDSLRRDFKSTFLAICLSKAFGMYPILTIKNRDPFYLAFECTNHALVTAMLIASSNGQAGRWRGGRIPPLKLPLDDITYMHSGWRSHAIGWSGGTARDGAATVCAYNEGGSIASTKSRTADSCQLARAAAPMKTTTACTDLRTRNTAPHSVEALLPQRSTMRRWIINTKTAFDPHRNEYLQISSSRRLRRDLQPYDGVACWKELKSKDCF